MRRSKRSIFALIKEHLAIALLVALTQFCFAVFTAHAQEPAPGGGWVVLPVDGYRALRARAFPAGVLPVRVDVPRAGASYRFLRTLVLDEPTRLTFNYRAK